MQNKTNKSRAMIREEQAMFRRIFGQLNWTSTQSRPDISFDVRQLSTKLNVLCHASKPISKTVLLKEGWLFPL